MREKRPSGYTAEQAKRDAEDIDRIFTDAGFEYDEAEGDEETTVYVRPKDGA